MLFIIIDKNFIDLVYVENKYEVMGVNKPEQLLSLEFKLFLIIIYNV